MYELDFDVILRICIGMCGDPSVVLIYGTCGMENCIVVLIEVVNEDCE